MKKEDPGQAYLGYFDTESPMENVAAPRITKTPGVCGGRACIAGHRIRVIDVVAWHERRGMSPEEIVREFPGLTVADVLAALAYYFDHRQEIEDDIREDERLAEWASANVPSRLKERPGG